MYIVVPSRSLKSMSNVIYELVLYINPFVPNAPFFRMLSGGRERVYWERMG